MNNEMSTLNHHEFVCDTFSIKITIINSFMLTLYMSYKMAISGYFVITQGAVEEFSYMFCFYVSSEAGFIIHLNITLITFRFYHVSVITFYAFL